MGQGADSCGAYEVDDDQYADGLAGGMWTQRDGSKIRVDQMDLRHLQNSKRLVEKAAREATFSSDADMWLEWAELFGEAISRKQTTKLATPAKQKALPRGAQVELVCSCGQKYTARVADIKRGLGKACSKRCASIRREYGRPEAKPVEVLT